MAEPEPYYVIVECDTIEDLRRVRRAIHEVDAGEKDFPFRPDAVYDAYGRPSRYAEAKALFESIKVPNG